MDESSGLRQRSQSSGHLGVSLWFEGTLWASFLEGPHFTESHLSWRSQRHMLWVKWNPISVVFILFFFLLPCIMGSVSVEEADTTGQGFSSKHFQWTHLSIWGFVTSISWPFHSHGQRQKRPGLDSVPSEKNLKPSKLGTFTGNLLQASFRPSRPHGFVSASLYSLWSQTRDKGKAGFWVSWGKRLRIFLFSQVPLANLANSHSKWNRNFGFL